VYSDGQQQHAVRTVQPDYGHGLYIRAYNSMFAGTGKPCKDEGLYISREDYSAGYALYAFDLTADLGKRPLQSRVSGKRPPLVEILGGARQHRHRRRLRGIRECYRGGSRQERRLRFWSMNTEEIDRILRRQCARDFDGVFSVDTTRSPASTRLQYRSLEQTRSSLGGHLRERRSRRIFRFVRTSTQRRI